MLPAAETSDILCLRNRCLRRHRPELGIAYSAARPRRQRRTCLPGPACDCAGRAMRDRVPCIEKGTEDETAEPTVYLY